MSRLYQQQKGFNGNEANNAFWEKQGYNGKWKLYPKSMSFLIEKEWKNKQNITKYNTIYYQNNNGTQFVIDLNNNIEIQLNSNIKPKQIRRNPPKINCHVSECPNCHFIVNETQNECDICDINIQQFLLNQFKKQQIKQHNNDTFQNNKNANNNPSNSNPSNSISMVNNPNPGNHNNNDNNDIIVIQKKPVNRKPNPSANNDDTSPIFCPKCNNACKSTFKFCPSCGNDIRDITLKRNNNINNNDNNDDNNIPGNNIDNIIDLTNSDIDISMSKSKEPGQSSDNESYIDNIE